MPLSDERNIRVVLTAVEESTMKRVSLKRINLAESSHHSEVKNLTWPDTSSKNDSEDNRELELEMNQNETNRSYVKRLVSELLKVCAKRKLGKIMTRIERKFNRSLENACDERIDDPFLAEFLKRKISDINTIYNQTNYNDKDKMRVAEIIKQCIININRGSLRNRKKVFKLGARLNKLIVAINKLEEMEVSSDDEYENPYVTLGRYRAKANKTYEKICSLEGRQGGTVRDVYLAFIFTQNVAAPKSVINALQKHYNETKMFPNWHDTLKLFKKVVRDEKLNYSASQIYFECKELFQCFGKQLQKRRQRDDYNLICSYLDSYEIDPAENDSDLASKLDQNQAAFKKAEAHIFDEFAFRSETEEDEKQEMEDEKHFEFSDEEKKELIDLFSTSDSDSD